MLSFLGIGGAAPHEAPRPTSDPNSVTLLVIQEDAYNWEAIFADSRLQDGRRVRVVQTSWRDMAVGPTDNFSSSQCIVTVFKRWVDGKPVEGRPITLQPDFLLVRNEVRTAGQDHKNKLLAFMYCNVPSVNSLSSILLCMDKPVVLGGMNKAMKTFGKKQFPVIEQSFMPEMRGFMYGGAFPAVLKFGSFHAGYGKVKVNHYHDMNDFRTLLPCTTDGHCTAEPFVEGKYDLRIQRIGSHVRAYRRDCVSGDWKTNTGTSFLKDIEVTTELRRWTDIAFDMLGPGNEMDICTVDAIVSAKDGTAVILEVNGTSSGLGPDHDAEDNVHIRDLVLTRMSKAIPTK